MQRQRDLGFGAQGFDGGGFGGGNAGGGFGGGFGGGNGNRGGFGGGNAGGGFGGGNGGGGFGGGNGRGFGGRAVGARRNGQRERSVDVIMEDGENITRREMTMSEIREEFKPQITSEKRNEWLKWIDDRSKQYSIEPATTGIKNGPKDSKDNSYPDTFVYQTSYGTLEVQKQFVENYVTKPVDSIIRARAKRDPLVVNQDYRSYVHVIPSTDPPNRYNLMDLFMEESPDYTEFCEDLYENYQETHFGGFDWDDDISFDEITRELCLPIFISDSKRCVKTLGMRNIPK